MQCSRAAAHFDLPYTIAVGVPERAPTPASGGTSPRGGGSASPHEGGSASPRGNTSPRGAAAGPPSPRGEPEPFAVRPDASLLCRREQLRYDLLESELKYIETLSTVVEDYLGPLRKASAAGVLSGEQVRTLFGNIDAIYVLHSDFAPVRPLLARALP